MNKCFFCIFLHGFLPNLAKNHIGFYKYIGYLKKMKSELQGIRQTNTLNLYNTPLLGRGTEHLIILRVEG